MIHPKNVPNYQGTLIELANEISNMDYLSLTDFLGYLADDIYRQAEADKYRVNLIDENKKRVKLASQLENVALKLHEAKTETGLAAKICKPFMKTDK